MPHCEKQLITFLVTSKCNLNCSYCYARETRTDDVIDLDFCKAGIDDFFVHTPHRWIRFFGDGEPTMAFNRVVQIYDYAKLKCGDNPLRAEMQTNGVFSKEVAMWIAANMTDIWISMDGPKDIHNKHRGEYDTVAENVALIRELNPTIFIGARPTITHDTVNRQGELLDHFVKLGFDAVAADPICEVVGDKTTERLDMMTFAEAFCDAWHKYRDIIPYISMHTVNFDGHCEIGCRAMTPNPHLTADGYVSACDMCVNHNSPMAAKLIYGMYVKGSGRIVYWQDKIDQIRKRNIHNLPHCQECPILQYCAGGCVGEGFNESGKLLGVNPEVCKAKIYMANRMGVVLGDVKNRYFHP